MSANKPAPQEIPQPPARDEEKEKAVQKGDQPPIQGGENLPSGVKQGTPREGA